MKKRKRIGQALSRLLSDPRSAIVKLLSLMPLVNVALFLVAAFLVPLPLFRFGLDAYLSGLGFMFLLGLVGSKEKDVNPRKADR